MMVGHTRYYQQEITNPTQTLDERTYTVRPTHFWMDKILERENQKPIADSKAPQERHLIEKTVNKTCEHRRKRYS